MFNKNPTHTMDKSTTRRTGSNNINEVGMHTILSKIDKYISILSMYRSLDKGPCDDSLSDGIQGLIDAVGDAFMDIKITTIKLGEIHDGGVKRKSISSTTIKKDK
ncbi:MAG: hypothetical protein 1 [Alphanucleorhabdovirus xinjianensis]|uniref:Uncharacterized protein n=1 Tax=Xinjiang nucleorhabdovirus TaxID=2824629 RepID=A0AAE9IG41_9RHAB|nr:MAG: hypothetical protein 1 [Xinjiang nucleorhabdovirus]